MSRLSLVLLFTFSTIGSLAGEESPPTHDAPVSGVTVLMDQEDLSTILAELAAMRQQNDAISAELKLLRLPAVEQSQATFSNASFTTEADVIGPVEPVADGYIPLADCYCPGWAGRVGYVQLWRETTGSDFSILTGAGGSFFFNASQLEFSTAPTIDASLFWDSGYGDTLEIRYLGLADYSIQHRADETLNPATNPVTPIGGNLVNPDVFYDSQFQSLELLGRPFSWPGLSYGLRYVDLDEDLLMIEGGHAQARFSGKNRLFGLQFGLERTLWDHGRGLRVDGSLKAGAYFNNVHVSSSFVGFSFPESGSGEDRNGELAFVGECSIIADYAMNDRWSLRAGAQLMFLDGVALATDQVPNTGNLNAAGSTTVPVRIDSSSLIYFGLHLGVERCW